MKIADIPGILEGLSAAEVDFILVGEPQPSCKVLLYDSRPELSPSASDILGAVEGPREYECLLLNRRCWPCRDVLFG